MRTKRNPEKSSVAVFFGLFIALLAAVSALMYGNGRNAVEKDAGTAPPPAASMADTSAVPAYPEGSNLYILMYHDVQEIPEEDCGAWTTTPKRLREDVEWLIDNGFEFYLPRDVAEGKKLNEKAVMLVFDDGYDSLYNSVLPILREYNVPAAVSLIVSTAEDDAPPFLTWEMCRAMSSTGLFEFGSHTYDRHITGIGREENESVTDYERRVLGDIQKSIDLIEKNLGQRVNFFAFPHGITEEWADRFLESHFKMTVCSEYGVADLHDGTYYLPRINVNAATDLRDHLK